MQDPSKRPLSPEELFQKLMIGNYKQAECVDEAAKIKEERLVLLELIKEYQAEISKRVADREQLEQLLELRARVRVELQKVRDDRISIDRNIADEITKFKLTPIEVREISQWKSQLEEYQCKNSKLIVRVKELTDYATKIEKYNMMLEKEKKIYSENRGRSNSYTVVSSASKDCCENWRDKIRVLREEQEMFTREVRERMKEKEHTSLTQIRHQEAEIAERNRRRLESFRVSYPLTPFYPNV